jgi:hypothetical protein
MDAKSAFLSALNAALITFIWTGAKLTGGSPPLAEALGVAATAIALLALMLCLWAIAPRQSLRALFGRNVRWESTYKPLSFYGFIATAYKPTDFQLLAADAGTHDETDLALEALEQHFTVSHTVYIKGLWVARASYLSMLAVFFTGISLLVR